MQMQERFSVTQQPWLCGDLTIDSGQYTSPRSVFPSAKLPQVFHKIYILPAEGNRRQICSLLKCFDCVNFKPEPKDLL